MASLIDIYPASAQDFSTLAHIAAVAMSVDLVHRIIYEGNDPFETSRQEQSVRAELGRAVSNPQAHIYKATLKSSEEIVGYALFRFEDGKETALPAGSPVLSFTPGTNANFLERILTEVRAKHSTYMAGKRHIWWTHLMVLPRFQRKGVGSALFRYAFENLGADDVPIWLVTQMRGRAMYLKSGFQDVDVLDIDLSEYAGPYNGFGIQRNICMVREPGGIASPELRADVKW